MTYQDPGDQGKQQPVDPNQGGLFDAHHDGKTYDPALDKARLNKQLGRVFEVMSDGEPRSLSDIARFSTALGFAGSHDSEAAVSARIRDLRKKKFGGYDVHSERIEGGLWHYWISETDCVKEQGTLLDESTTPEDEDDWHL